MLTLIFLWMAPYAGNAQCPWANRGVAPAGPCYWTSRIPGLTVEQQTRIDELRTDYWKDLDKDRAALREERLNLQRLRAEEDVDVKKVNKAIDRVNDLEAAVSKRGVQYREDIRALLDDEQKAYFDQLGNRAFPARGNRPGRGLGPCGRLNG